MAVTCYRTQDKKTLVPQWVLMMRKLIEIPGGLMIGIID